MKSQEIIRQIRENRLGKVYKHLYKSYPSIKKWILSNSGTKQDAEDIFQETFIKIVKMLRSGKYTDDGRFAQYAVRIARNMSIDHFRRTKNKPTINGETGESILDSMSFAENKQKSMEKDEEVSTIRRLVDELPDDQKEVLLLRHYGDMSFKEIADLTKVPLNTALGRMRYALINMRKLIEKKSLVL